MYIVGSSLATDLPSKIAVSWMFKDRKKYFMNFPNFSYEILDLSKDASDKIKYQFLINDKIGKPNGFGFELYKNGNIYGAEMINGRISKFVKLPNSYITKAESIFNDIKRSENIALDEQRKALIIKEKYKKKICKNNIKVNFMDNDEYKDICKENEKIAKLREKIDKKLAKMGRQKQEEKLIRARELEAQAAQRKAQAAEQANLNQSIQNATNALQMQQLNNNIMMNNLLPKRYDVYIH